jgi:hypothetical protein
MISSFATGVQIWDRAFRVNAFGGRRGSGEMAKRIRKRSPGKLKRNPLARVLAGAKYRPRVVKKAGLYTRRPKHRKPDENGA